MKWSRLALLATVACALAWRAPVASATAMYTYATSSLPVLTDGGSYYFDVQFVGDNGNTVTVTDHNFTGGSGSGTFALGTDGSLSITTTGFFPSSFTEQFLPGTPLTFSVAPPPDGAVGPTLASGGIPDEFSIGVYLMDGSGTPGNVQTSDPVGVSDGFPRNALLVLDFYSDVTTTHQYVIGTGVPEPAGSGLALAALAFTLTMWRRRPA